MRFPIFPVIAAGIVAFFVVALFIGTPSPTDPFSNHTGWIGTPATLGGQKTVVVFWSLSCERCLNGIPLLKSLENQSTLRIIGVHSPEYAIERTKLAAQSAIRQYHWTAPLALDYNQSIWPYFSKEQNQSTVYAYDEKSRLVSSHAALTPEYVNALQTWANDQNTVWPQTQPKMPNRIYVGYLVAEPNIRTNFKPLATSEYVLPDTMQPNTPYLYGSWFVGPDFARANAPAKVWLTLTDPQRIFTVAYSPNGYSRVLLDGAPIDQQHAGAGLLETPAGYLLDASIFGLYLIAQNLDAGLHNLVLDVPAGFTLYRFTVE